MCLLAPFQHAHSNTHTNTLPSLPLTNRADAGWAKFQHVTAQIAKTRSHEVTAGWQLSVLKQILCTYQTAVWLSFQLLYSPLQKVKGFMCQALHGSILILETCLFHFRYYLQQCHHANLPSHHCYLQNVTVKPAFWCLVFTVLCVGLLILSTAISTMCINW